MCWNIWRASKHIKRCLSLELKGIEMKWDTTTHLLLNKNQMLKTPSLLKIWDNWNSHIGKQTISSKIKYAVSTLPSNPNLGHLSMNNKNVCPHRDLDINEHSLSIIASNWTQPKCWHMNKLWIHTMGYIPQQ